MKTAEEYIPDSMPCAEVWRRIVREIQLDAMKEGMIRASAVCHNSIQSQGPYFKTAILAVAEQLTTSDLP